MTEYNEPDEREPDPPEFDRSKVPDGPASEFFFDGRTGRGLTDEEYDETVQRYRDAGMPLPWEGEGD